MASQDIWTVQRTMNWCVEYLERHGDANPRLSAEWLMSSATGLSRVEIYAYFDRPLSVEERDTLRESLRRRGQGEPLQYVTGEAAFRHIILRTAKGVLIPRPETELLVQLVLDALPGLLAGAKGESPRVLEVGCGTGCVALSLAKEAGVHVTATDISPQAIACAARNAQALQLEDLVELVETDCTVGIDGPFDVLVSNPPYIPTAVMEGLEQEVLGYEPHLALDGGADGLDFFDRLLTSAPSLLAKGAFFACELHETCLDKAKRRMETAGFSCVRIEQDLAGKPRFIVGYWENGD